MANQVVSLAYYVSQARRSGATQEALSAANESYGEVLPRFVDLSQAVASWNMIFEADDALVPLSEIDIAQTDYLDLVEQVFRGVSFRDVRLCAVAAPPPPPSTHAPYFPQYLATILGTSAHGVLRDFFTRHAELDALLTDEVRTANDIAVTCRRPITYQYGG